MGNMNLTHADALEAERILCARSFAYFVKRAWRHIIPDVLVWNWHMDAICAHMQALAKKQIPSHRLLINVPPGASKSTLVGVMYSAWLWGPGCEPWHRYIGVAHEQGLAVRDNRLTRELVSSAWYQRLWPIAFKSDQNEKLYFENDKRGFRQACSISGITGRRGHTVSIDDPHTPEKAYSETERENAIRIMSETIPLRLNDPITSAIVVVMQRLHERDVSGYLLSEELGYEHLMIPMEFEPSRRHHTSIGWTDPRTEDGELMFPERFPASVIDRDKKALGPYAYAGQMQQRPAPRQGGMFPVDRFAITDHKPADADIADSLRYWDKAGTAGGGAFTVGALMHKMKDGRFCVSDIRRGQLSALDRERLIKQTAEADGYQVRIGIEQEPGSGGKESAEATIRMLAGYRISADRPTGDKETRAEPYAAQVQGGNVLLVRADWNRAFMDEHEMFPNGKYKDQVDAAGAAFAGLNTGSSYTLSGIF